MPEEETKTDGEMKRWRIHWIDGSTTIIEGKSFGFAFVNAGYGTGHLQLTNWTEPLIDEKKEGEK